VTSTESVQPAPEPQSPTSGVGGTTTVWVYGPVGSEISFLREGQLLSQGVRLPGPVEFPPDTPVLIKLKWETGGDQVSQAPVSRVEELQAAIDKLSAHAPTSDRQTKIDQKIKTWAETILAEQP
jgi:hypothetical protein